MCLLGVVSFDPIFDLEAIIELMVGDIVSVSALVYIVWIYSKTCTF